MGFGGDTRHLRFVLPNRLAAMCEVSELNAELGVLRGDDERSQTKGRVLVKEELTLTSLTVSFVVEETLEM